MSQIKTPAYQQLVLHALELLNAGNSDGVDIIAHLVAQSHATTITDVRTFANDVRREYLARSPFAKKARKPSAARMASLISKG